MTTYGMRDQPNRLRKGDVVVQTVDTRAGAHPAVVVFTPCCQVTYYVRVEDVDRFYRDRRWVQECGKVQHGRGNKPGDPGCRWRYEVEFVWDESGRITTARWTV